MFEFLATVVMAMVVGFYIGLGVLINRENATINKFMRERPVMAWPITCLVGVLAIYATLYIFMITILAIVSLVLGGHGFTRPQ
jgi:hypothetical protein